MKLRPIFFACIVHTLCIQTEENNQFNQQPSSNYTVIINAQTQSGLDQDNNLNQNAKHTSIPITTVETNVNRPEQAPQKQKKELKPDESMIKFAARNLVKGGVIYAAGCWCPPLVIGYLVNRLLVQPILDNGNILETVSAEEKKEYAEKGLLKVADLRVFPVGNRIKEFFTR